MKARSVEEEQKIVEGSKILTEMQSVMERFRKGEFASEYFSFINVQKSYHASDIEHTAQMKLKEGRNIGRLEGEKQKALSTAKNLLADGINPHQVAKYTGLKESDIAKIKIN